MDAIEAAARAMCHAKGIDPDAIGYGMGHAMPEGETFPLWRAQEAAARAAIAAFDTARRPAGEWICGHCGIRRGGTVDSDPPF